MNVRTDPPSKPSVQAFLQTLHQSGLLSREQIRDALAACPAEAQTNAARLAEYCVASGLLTRFQADKLLEGVTVGLVLGPYHVLSPIGRGGMGTVYLARDNRNRELVALKVLPPKRAKQDEVTLARFRREMDLARVVCHPRITQTYEVGVVQGIYYIAMEYVAGRSLAQYLHEVGTLPVGRAARVAIEIAEGLEQAHARGLIHRDLKPSNVMLTHDGHCKILDFGLAIMQDEEPPGDISITGGKGYVVGTMDYISPEQAEDPLQVDPRSDLYSLGCSLYRMTAGRVPFPGGNGLQKIMRHRTELAPLVHTLNPDIPREFSELIARFMAKDPSDRPQNRPASTQVAGALGRPDHPGPKLLGTARASRGVVGAARPARTAGQAGSAAGAGGCGSSSGKPASRDAARAHPATTHSLRDFRDRRDYRCCRAHRICHARLCCRRGERAPAARAHTDATSHSQPHRGVADSSRTGTVGRGRGGGRAGTRPADRAGSHLAEPLAETATLPLATDYALLPPHQRRSPAPPPPPAPSLDSSRCVRRRAVACGDGSGAVRVWASPG
jgi:hypothetical protein